MAREFSVITTETSWWPGVDEVIPLGQLIEKKEGFVVGESSHFIFEPRDGDRDEDGYTYNNKLEAWVSMPCDDENLGELVKMKLPEESKTARRDNKPFFWPEGKDG